MDDARTVLRLVLLVTFLAVLTVTLTALRVHIPLLGRLPGDMELVLNIGILDLPVTSSIVLGLGLALLARLVTRSFDHTT